MDLLVHPLTEIDLFALLNMVGEWDFLLALPLLMLELIRYAVKRQMSWRLIGDVAANYVVLAFYLLTEILIFGGLYLTALYVAYETAWLSIDLTLGSALICLILADLAYYWEHRAVHRINLGWATHSVHHSSPHYNLSVAFRFGPLDAASSIPFHAFLVWLGFPPVLVLFSTLIVLVYQTVLHTEVIGKLPRAFEWIFNTPSHHRVHHGSNPEYIDKNYAGLLIIWDRLFGTFAEEKAKVIYGLSSPINSVNPLWIFVQGVTELGRKVARSPGFSGKSAALFYPPEWAAPKSSSSSSAPSHE